MRGLTIGCVVMASLVASSAEAQVVWQGDFETGDTSQFRNELNGMIGGSDYIVVEDTLVAEGMWAARVELHNDAVWPNGLKRVELNYRPDNARTAEGASLYFAWSFYLPDTLPSDPSQTIGYWESDVSYQQMMAFQLAGTDLSFVTRRPSNVTQWTGAGVATPGEWHRIAMRVLWSTDGGTGRVDVWFDGLQVVTDAAAQTLADDNPHFIQMGLLRGMIEFSDVAVIYLDDAVEGDTLADVRPDGQPAMPPIDAGVGVDGGGMGATDAGPTAGADAGTGPRADAGPDDTGDGGCAVRPAPRGAPVWLVAFGAVLAAGRRRRRRPTVQVGLEGRHVRGAARCA